MLLHLKNQRVVQSRLIATTGRRMAFTTVTGIDGNLQHVADENTQRAVGGVFGKVYRFFCEATEDVQEGDQIRDEAGKIYKVVAGGVTRRTQGAMDYLEVTMQRTT